MKASHYTTPRTLQDADFQAWGAAIETPPPKSRAADIFVAVICVAACAAIGALCAQAF